MKEYYRTGRVVHIYYKLRRGRVGLFIFIDFKNNSQIVRGKRIGCPRLASSLNPNTEIPREAPSPQERVRVSNGNFGLRRQGFSLILQRKYNVRSSTVLLRLRHSTIKSGLWHSAINSGIWHAGVHSCLWNSIGVSCIWQSFLNSCLRNSIYVVVCYRLRLLSLLYSILFSAFTTATAVAAIADVSAIIRYRIRFPDSVYCASVHSISKCSTDHSNGSGRTASFLPGRSRYSSMFLKVIGKK